MAIEEIDDAVYEGNDAPKETKVCLLPRGENKLAFDKGRKVGGVLIHGLRNRPMRLRRQPLDILKSFYTDVRGVPTAYAIENKERVVYVWPRPNVDMTFTIEYAEKQEESEDVV